MTESICGICLDNLKTNPEIEQHHKTKDCKKTLYLDCHHEFHHNCIFEWCTKSLTCPICRSDIEKESLKNHHSLQKEKFGEHSQRFEIAENNLNVHRNGQSYTIHVYNHENENENNYWRRISSYSNFVCVRNEYFIIIFTSTIFLSLLVVPLVLAYKMGNRE